ncbi:PREDICTED: transcription factor GTE12-like [Tarenaya hassleriana]|uniref:transcription factor GTE12-like n=1 Tax=Tarenaya hassleriana TaxID=28532 RepID=UPI00053C4C16|nr:PREDICTED: transcription factor GTE12-like [Tarenaya hassleriana]XP_010532235.1 PREDICTED: transcription factor GTE12-like [Tarenaya hassleriana]
MVIVPKLVIKLGKGVFVANGSRKRGAEEIDDIQTKKKPKVKQDQSVTPHCSVLLESAMEHRFGWVFYEPVDPVKLNLPDYFSVVSEPMDFKTIERKIEKNAYGTVDGFANDVRLIFSNAMLYNPPENLVHKMAKELKEFFEAVFLDKTRSETQALSPVSTLDPTVEKTRKNATTKQRLVKKLNHGPVGTHLTLKRCSKLANVGCDRENGAPNFDAGHCGSCCMVTTDSSLQFRSTTGKDLDLETGSASSSITADCMAKRNSGSQHTSKPNPHPDGSVISVNEDDGRCLCSSQPRTSISPDPQGKTTAIGVSLSPKRALRAELLKSRYADTILKARKVLGHTSKTDPKNKQQEKEELERMQHKEKPRIEAKVAV